MPRPDPEPADGISDPEARDPEGKVWDDYLQGVLEGDAEDLDEFWTRHDGAGSALRERLEKLRQLLSRDPSSIADPPISSEGPPDADLPFERIGDFRLLRKLGEGGMGVVYLAEQVSLGRLVALKVIHPARQGSAEAEERFRREGLAVARLRHPNIVAVFATGEEKGVLYIAMELVPGLGLDEVLADASARGRALPVSSSLRWIAALARALEAAHRSGLVHRDVNPSNIRIAPDGRAMLVDFGLARRLHEEEVTLTAQFLGTPRYASPEQISTRGSRIDARTDVYSLGVTLFECVTGSPPFEGETTEQLFSRILTKDPVSPRRLNPSIPRDLETVVLRALEKDPDRRYPTAEAFAEDLEALLEIRPIRARPAGAVTRGRKWARRNPASAVTIVTILCASVWVVGGSLERGWSVARAFRGEVESARAFLDAGNFGEAMAAVERALGIRPSDAAARNLRADIARSRDRATVEAALLRARPAFTTYVETRAKLTPLLLRIRRERTRAESEYVSPADRDAHLADEREASLLRTRLEGLYLDIVEALSVAGAVLPVDAEVEKRLGDIHLERWKEAMESGDEAVARVYRQKALLHDRDGELRAQIDGTGRVAFATSPERARVHLFQYVPLDRFERGGGDRLVPVPHRVAASLPDSPDEPRRIERGVAVAPGSVALAVEAVEVGSPAHEAGITAGDLIVAVASFPVGDEEGAEPMLVAGIDPAGAVAAAGIEPFDRLIRLRSLEIREEHDLEEAFGALAAGAEFEATVRRKRADAPVVVRATKRDSIESSLGCDVRRADAALLAGDLPILGVYLTVWGQAEMREVLLSGGKPAGLRLSRTACPLSFGPDSLLGESPLPPVDLAPGSYLFVFRSEGYEDLRFPVRIARGDDLSYRVPLLAAGTTPPGFVWVPAGPFLAGGDPQAPRSVEAIARELPGFWIARLETTVAEYAEYLNDPATLAEIDAAGPAGPKPRVPRPGSARLEWTRAADGAYRTAQDPRSAVLGVAWEDAVAFARWKSDRARDAGERWRYELPNEEEWEKAARGVDGRFFPWGNTGDWRYFMGGLSRPEMPRPEPVGRFILGESPWGVHDMAGSAMEWCMGWVREGEAHPQRGGVWAAGSFEYTRAASRGPRVPGAYSGFRLVARRSAGE